MNELNLTPDKSTLLLKGVKGVAPQEELRCSSRMHLQRWTGYWFTMEPSCEATPFSTEKSPYKGRNIYIYLYV